MKPEHCFCGVPIVRGRISSAPPPGARSQPPWRHGAPPRRPPPGQATRSSKFRNSGHPPRRKGYRRDTRFPRPPTIRRSRDLPFQSAPSTPPSHRRHRWPSLGRGAIRAERHQRGREFNRGQCRYTDPRLRQARSTTEFVGEAYIDTATLSALGSREGYVLSPVRSGAPGGTVQTKSRSAGRETVRGWNGQVGSSTTGAPPSNSQPAARGPEKCVPFPTAHGKTRSNYITPGKQRTGVIAR